MNVRPLPTIVALVYFYTISSFTQEMKQTFLALGDSYTIGEAVDPAERWPMQVAAELRRRDFDVADPVIIARTGWTTDELDAAIDEANPTGPFKIVSLLIGVNNQYRGRDKEEYRGQFKRLLERAAGFAGGLASHVVVVSIPDWGVMPFAEGRDRKAIAREIDAFNAINWEESVMAGAQYVDITPISREVERFPELVASDALHPSAVQYKYWTEVILPKFVKILESPTGKEEK